MSPPTAPSLQSATGENAAADLRQLKPMSSVPGPSSTPPYSRDSPFHGPSPHSVSLPPLRDLSRTPPVLSTDRRSGTLGLHSMLNPQAELVEQHRDMRRSASQTHTPSPIEMPATRHLPSITRPPSASDVRDECVGVRHFAPPEKPSDRPILSPISPTLQRTHSLSVGIPTGTIDAHRQPFLSSGNPSYAAETPAPPPGVTRITYFPVNNPTAPTPSPNVPRKEARRLSLGVSFPQPGTASPMASYSPYSQPSSTASSQLEVSNSQGPFLPMKRELSNPPIIMDTERTTSQSAYQMMTIKNHQGHHLQIPVEVQAGSKQADERRKRNAGASARFRARRKEREREDKNTISRLEHQLRDALEDVEHYRSERDFFRALASQHANAEHQHTRPVSPRLRRPSVAFSNAPSSNGAGGSISSYSAYEEMETEDLDRNVRRRTSSYHPPAGLLPLPGSNTPGSTIHGQSGSSQVAAPLQSQSQPLQHYDVRDRSFNVFRQPQPDRPVLRNPFAQDAARYQHRD